MGHVRNKNMKDCWSSEPTVYTPSFTPSMYMSRNHFYAICYAWHFITTSSTHKTQAAASKLSMFISISFASSDQVTACKENCSSDKGMTPWKGHMKLMIHNPEKITV
jgi:hypothetical protein